MLTLDQLMNGHMTLGYIAWANEYLDCQDENERRIQRHFQQNSGQS